MTEHDVLARAAKALRSAHTGEHQGSGFTRARIMTSLHKSRRGRLYRWAIGAPLASVLLVGSAWAQSTGKWPAVWAAVSAVFTAAPEPSEPSGALKRTNQKNEARAESSERAAPPAIDDLEQEAPAQEPAPEPTPALEPEPSEPESTPRVPSPSAPASTSRAHRSPAHRTSSKPAQPAPEPQPREPAEPAAQPERAADPELARFRAAHELHFQADRPERAIEAYEAYLREFPRGRFVPEARYNMALDFIKLGDKGRARAELQPFAAGRYGDYRKREAQQLLEALK